MALNQRTDERFAERQPLYHFDNLWTALQHFSIFSTLQYSGKLWKNKEVIEKEVIIVICIHLDYFREK